MTARQLPLALSDTKPAQAFDVFWREAAMATNGTASSG
jgi:hypothetical protein